MTATDNEQAMWQRRGPCLAEKNLGMLVIKKLDVLPEGERLLNHLLLQSQQDMLVSRA